MNKTFIKTMNRICKRDDIKNADLFKNEVWFSVEMHPSDPMNRRVKRARDEYYRELKR